MHDKYYMHAIQVHVEDYKELHGFTKDKKWMTRMDIWSWGGWTFEAEVKNWAGQMDVRCQKWNGHLELGRPMDK